MKAVDRLLDAIESYTHEEIKDQQLSELFDELAPSIPIDKITYQEIFELTLQGNSIEAITLLELGIKSDG